MPKYPSIIYEAPSSDAAVQPDTLYAYEVKDRAGKGVIKVKYMDDQKMVYERTAHEMKDIRESEVTSLKKLMASPTTIQKIVDDCSMISKKTEEKKENKVVSNIVIEKSRRIGKLIDHMSKLVSVHLPERESEKTLNALMLLKSDLKKSCASLTDSILLLKKTQNNKFTLKVKSLFNKVANDSGKEVATYDNLKQTQEQLIKSKEEDLNGKCQEAAKILGDIQVKIKPACMRPKEDLSDSLRERRARGKS